MFVESTADRERQADIEQTSQNAQRQKGRMRRHTLLKAGEEVEHNLLEFGIRGLGNLTVGPARKKGHKKRALLSLERKN